MNPNPGVGLTDEDFDTLRDMAENGVRSYARPGGGDGPTPEPKGVPVTCRKCGYVWRFTGRSRRATCSVCGAKTNPASPPEGDTTRGVPIELCNAIRAAAHDGQSFGAIARLFTSINSRETARLHATGRCSHGDGDYPPLTEDRDAGFGHRKVDADTCRQLREGFNAGVFNTFTEAGDAVGCFRTTAARHIKGECGH